MFLTVRVLFILIFSQFVIGCRLGYDLRGTIGGSNQPNTIVDSVPILEVDEGDSLSISLNLSSPQRSSTTLVWSAVDTTGRLSVTTGDIQISEGASVLQFQIPAKSNSTADGNSTIEVEIKGKDFATYKFLIRVVDTSIRASLNNTPESLNVDSALTVSVSGSLVTAYKYKLGLASSTDCANSSGYSTSSVDISVPITDSLTSYLSEQDVRLCVIGGTSGGLWQSYSRATSLSWKQDFWTTVSPTNAYNLVQESNSNQNLTLNFSISQPKPSPTVIDYIVYSPTSGSPTSLSNGSITVAAYATSFSLPYIVYGNATIDGTRRVYLSLSGSNKRFLNFGSSQTLLIDILDDESSEESFIKVSSSNLHTCGIVALTGVLKCWGRNNNGQLGDGTTIDRITPVIVDSGVSYSDVATGSNHTCAVVTGSGVLKCWGLNSGRQLGDSTTTTRLSPVVINSGVSYVSVSAGSLHSCGIVASTRVLKCWGTNTDGQVGDGSFSTRSTPVIVNSGVSYQSVASGDLHNCGIVVSSNVLKCWGKNSDGQVGDGTTSNRASPVIINTGEQYSAIGLGRFHSCGVVVSTGQLKCWGQNASSQLGDGTTTNSTLPISVDVGLSYSSVAGGELHTCAIASSGGNMKCWGSNVSGQLGDGTYTNRLSSTSIDATVSYSALDTGSSHTCGIQATTGYLRCWGSNSHGQAGDMQTSVMVSPTALLSSFSFSEISVGESHACGIESSTKALRCWGNNSKGQLGDGTQYQKDFPFVVDAGVSYKKVSAGSLQTCAITDVSGILKCWGANYFGRLGIGNTVDSFRPLIVDSPTKYSAISSGSYHTCGIVDVSGAMKCWGYNALSQVGDGTTIDRWTPTLIDAGTSYASLSAGNGAGCGITRVSSQLKCWGNNVYGQLGDGTTTIQSVPTLIDASETYSMVSAGRSQACGITLSTGALKCWGRNNSGQLGDGTFTNRSTGVVVDSGIAYSVVSTRYDTTCAIQSSNSLLKCWGSNTYGQLGDGTLASKNLPVLINAGSQYSAVDAGATSSTGITTVGGQIKVWGSNTSGQLGTGGLSTAPKFVLP